MQAGGVESAACAAAENQVQESNLCHSTKRNDFKFHISLDFLGKGCYCYMVFFSRKSKDQTWADSNIPTTLRAVFVKELKRLGSIRSEATRNLIDDLTSS